MKTRLEKPIFFILKEELKPTRHIFKNFRLIHGSFFVGTGRDLPCQWFKKKIDFFRQDF